jgi:hypothetical protein
MNTSNIIDVREQDTPQESEHEVRPTGATAGPFEKDGNAGDGPAASEWQPGLDGRCCSGDERVSAEPATPVTPAPAQPVVYTSPLEPPERHDQCAAIPRGSPNVIAHLAKNYTPFAEQAGSLPPAGCSQLNQAIFFAAIQGLAEGQTPEQVYDILYPAGLKAGRPASELYREVWHAIENAVRYLSGPATDIGKSRSRQPRTDWDRIVSTARANGKVSDLVRESKPVPTVFADVLDLWFKPGELACLAGERHTASTRSVEDWKAIGLPPQFFVPNPMSAKYGRTREGELSERTLENVGARRILPVEFDFSPKAGPECARMLEQMQELGYSVKDVNAALHTHLDSMVPLGAAIDSGGKSIHGHYPCAHLSEEDLQRFKDCALVLGADPQVFVPNQLVRFPGGVRADNGKAQNLLYVNPEVMRHE